MKADVIREKFLKFFESKGHKIVYSDSLVPADDPTLLFTGAGMNQFKDYFLGIKKDFKRAASSQKCFRTGDIDNVGKTPSHHTFFEMLGNFSFGDYFKKEAIEWAWEFMTEELAIRKERLWVSVYKDDQEAYDIWRKIIKVPEENIVRFSDEDNFWPSQAKTKGPNGPCGPCSEIFFDQGKGAGCSRPDCSPACDCDRFIEVWNLVFTQYNRKDGGILEPLPMKNIDTGMGLERIAAVMQDVRSNFQTDLFAPIVKATESACHSEESHRFVPRSSKSEGGRRDDEESKKRDSSVAPKYAPYYLLHSGLPQNGIRSMSSKDKQYIYTIADHVRAVAFLVADGVLPSNEGRGYVERMVIRRAVRCGKQLGIEKPFLYKLVPAVARVMKKQYPQLEARRENISQIILKEEQRFSQTLQEGIQILEGLILNSKTKVIKGIDAFKLYDTYGFPLDLTEEIANQRGFKVDKAGFQRALDAQREASRRSSVISADIFATTFSQKIKKLTGSPIGARLSAKPREAAGHTEFIGYDNLLAEADVIAILRDEKSVQQAKQGDEVWVILDRTSFYGSSGGQVGDTGRIIKVKGSPYTASVKMWGLTSGDKHRLKVKGAEEYEGAILEVLDTRLFDKIIVHICKIKKGRLKIGDRVVTEVDKDRRLDIARNHTATHLLQSALRKVLGEHVHQSGSMVAPDKLRFDFTHFKALSAQQIERVEELVNANIQSDDKVSVRTMALTEAVESGAMALFDEKYEDKVRVVSVADYSKELCGGTHLEKVGQIGMFKITAESSISAGARRIEAVTGRFAADISVKQQKILKELSVMLGVTPEAVVGKIQDLQDRIKKLEASLEKSRKDISAKQTDGLILKSTSVGAIKLIASVVEDADMDILRLMVDRIKNRVACAAILLASQSQDKVSLVLAFSQDLVKKGFNAGVLIKDVSKIVDGSGGGRPDMAQAGGNDPSRLKDAFGKFEELLRIPHGSVGNSAG